MFSLSFSPGIKNIFERKTSKQQKSQKEKLRKKGKSTLHNAQQYKHLAANGNSRKVTNENL